MSATPGSILDDLAFPFRRNLFEKICVIRELDGLVLLEQFDRIRQGHLAVAMMVAIALAVGSNALELRLRVLLESRFEARCKCLSRVQQAFKSDCARSRTIIKEDRNRN